MTTRNPAGKEFSPGHQQGGSVALPGQVRAGLAAHFDA